MEIIEDRYYTVPELAELWRTSTKYVYNQLRSGALEGMRLSRTGGWRITNTARLAFEARISNVKPTVSKRKASAQIV